MKLFKKIAVVAFALIMLCGVLAGCTATPEAVEDERGVTVEGNKVYVEEFKGKNLISIAYFDTGYGKDWIYEIAKDFVYENPDYALLLEADSSLVTNMENKLTTSKNLSDLYFTPHFNWEQYVAQGALTVLDDVYSAKPDGDGGKTIEEKMEPVYAEGCVMERNGTENYYVMPWTKLITGIAYNVDLFERYELQVPTTMTEFNAVCEAIISKSTAEGSRIAPFVVPGKIGGYFDFLGMNWWIQASGIDAVKEFFAYDSVEVFNPAKQPYQGFLRMGEEFEKYFGTGSDQFAKYCLSGSMALDAYSAQRDFINGRAAMTINADWLEREMIELIKETDFNMKLMRVPYLNDAFKKDGEYEAINYAADANFVCLPARAENPDGAKKFLTFMNRDDELKKFTLATGALRPFEYDYASLRSELSPFANSVLDINDACTESFFDFATGPRRFKAPKFILDTPYHAIVNGTSPSSFCKKEYDEAQVRWNVDWAVD